MNILRARRKSKNKYGFKKLILLIFSLIMTTFAWFAYSKVLEPNLNIHIAAWNMEYYINEVKHDNPISIEIPMIYPAMPEEVITIDIKNNGEAQVELDYHVESITIAGVEYELVTDGNSNNTENFIKIATPVVTADPETGVALAKGAIINELEKFPFTLAVEHSLRVEPDDKGYLTVTANWIGDNNELDTEWGYIVGQYFTDNPDATSAMSLTLSIDSYQVDEEILPNTGSLPKAPGTRPYLPSSDYSQVAGTDLDSGLVITDSLGNEYVWVEVPKLASIYQTAGIQIKDFTDEEYTKIENDLHTYTATYRAGTVFKDEYSADASTGLTSEKYNELKKNMLKSVYQNGGFYIGRYEAGIDNKRTSHTSVTALTVSSQPHKYPLNYITCSEAQTLASKVATGQRTSSLMFGVQWDLVLKYIETKAVAQGTELSAIQQLLTQSSNSWGNYNGSQYSITNPSAQYSLNSGSTWYLAPYNKTSSGKVFLTTGANSTFAKQNIFDLGGNVWEWTLENTTNADNACALRGGSFEDTTENKANYRNTSYATFAYYSVGYRVTIY